MRALVCLGKYQLVVRYLRTHNTYHVTRNSEEKPVIASPDFSRGRGDLNYVDRFFFLLFPFLPARLARLAETSRGWANAPA